MVASTIPPAQDRRAFGNSARVWLGCVAFLVVVELYIVLIGGGLEKDPRTGLFSPPSIAAFGVVGFVGVWLSHRTGFPAAWDARISVRDRLVYPILWGIGVGVGLVFHDFVFPWTAAFKDIGRGPSFNPLGPVPGSLLFHAGGGILVAVFYRLLPSSLLL